ncbi:YcxB family protein [Oscillospiraceae bacterium LTW-04]|nr:YcxB family protein [Oscillospiraceae bacterium MB24-C1]
MKKAAFTVPVKVDGNIFKDFALFDTFRLQRRWKSPAVFVGIMLLLSPIAFSQVGKVEYAGLLGGVLLGIGALLPAVYFLSFFLSVRTQIRKLGLATPRHVYTLQFNKNDGVEASADKEQITYRWDELFAVYRTNHSIYLYVAPRKAYLLPNEQIEHGADALWSLMLSAMTVAKVHDYRNDR